METISISLNILGNMLEKVPSYSKIWTSFLNIFLHVWMSKNTLWHLQFSRTMCVIILYQLNIRYKAHTLPERKCVIHGWPPYKYNYLETVIVDISNWFFFCLNAIFFNLWNISLKKRNYNLFYRFRWIFYISSIKISSNWINYNKFTPLKA